VLRAGVVARDRVTAGLAGRIDAERAAGFLELRDDVLLGRVFRLGVDLFAAREGVGLRDEDFTDYSPGMTAMVRYYLRSTSRTEV
jgi:hypothetical protein